MPPAGVSAARFAGVDAGELALELDDEAASLALLDVCCAALVLELLLPELLVLCRCFFAMHALRTFAACLECRATSLVGHLTTLAAWAE